MHSIRSRGDMVTIKRADALAANMMATRELGFTARCEARPELRQVARSARILYAVISCV